MNFRRAIIFDSGTLITFVMNGLLPELRALRKLFKGKFFITPDVKAEVIDRPIHTKRFELEALKLQKLLDDNIIELPSSVGISDEELSEKTQEIMTQANTLFYAHGKAITIVSSGEVSCLSLYSFLEKNNVSCVIATDERTVRLLAEKPQNLRQLLQKKLKNRIQENPRGFDFFSRFRFLRSAELVYVAYKKGAIALKGEHVLDALLYATKFKGCAISSEEIEEMKRLARTR